MKHNWEKIADNAYRLKVFKGWIVKSIGGLDVRMVTKQIGTNNQCISLVFVSDEFHEWKL